MPSSPDITELWGNFKNLVKKITYDKTEVDNKLSGKTDFDHVHSRLVPTSIPANADLNDYTTQGSFYCSANTIATTIQNSPSDQAFHLEVYKTADLGVRQVVYAFPTSNTYSWQRNGYNGNWTDWYAIIDTSKVDSSLSSTSTYPVQNKVINTALNSKANSSHTHTSWKGIQPDAISTSGNESGGYRNIMQIKINGNYTDQPITFDFTTRNTARSVRVFISFAPTATKDPGLAYFKYDGWLSNDNELYLIKTATSTWNLYYKEINTYTSVAINNLFTGNQTKPNVTITFPNLRVTSLPTGTSYTASEWLATSSNSGSMSKGDKVKLDGIATGANKTIVDTALSSSSTNPVQNKVIYNAIGDIKTALNNILGA